MKKLLLILLMGLFGIQMYGQGVFTVDRNTAYSIAEYTTASNKEWVFNCTSTYIMDFGVTWADADAVDGTWKVQYSMDGGESYADAAFGDQAMATATGHGIIQDNMPVACDKVKVVYTNGSNTAITLTLNVKFTTYR